MGERTEMLVTIPLDPEDVRPAVSELLARWREPARKLFVLKAESAPPDILAFYDPLIAKLGTVCAFAEDVARGGRHEQRTGEVWMDVRFDPRIKDAYRHSANAQPLHTDGSYVSGYPNSTLMACETNAGDGGETTFIDADDLVSILEREAPDLLSELFAVVVPHVRSGDRRDLPILRRERDRIFVNWNYYCVDPNAPTGILDLRERFHGFLRESAGVRAKTIGVKLARGDAVVWKDEELLHGRNAFSADRPGERFLRKCAINVGVW